MNKITFITKSEQKIYEARRILGRDVGHRFFDLPEIQSINLEDVIHAKARAAFTLNGESPVVVEDTGLFIEAWDGLPGALVRWFIECVNVSGICRMMSGFQNRSAVARTIIGLYDGQLHTFSGEVKGSIASYPRGTNGFGWDSIFVPDGENRTFAEMTGTEKDHYSMRRIALEKLASFHPDL